MSEGRTTLAEAVEIVFDLGNDLCAAARAVDATDAKDVEILGLLHRRTRAAALELWRIETSHKSENLAAAWREGPQNDLWRLGVLAHALDHNPLDPAWEGASSGGYFAMVEAGSVGERLMGWADMAPVGAAPAHSNPEVDTP